MRDRFETISIFHASLLLITSVGVLNHVVILPALLNAGKRDAWMSILLCLPLLFVWFALLIVISRRTGQKNLVAWLEEKTNRFTASLFAFVIILYLVAASAVSLKDMVTWTSITYLPATPELFISLSFLILCFLTALTNLRAIAITNLILLPTIVFFGFFVAIANIPKKDYTAMMPMFEHGYGPVMNGMLFAGAGLVEITLILFVQHRVSSKIKYWHVAIIGTILAGLMFGPLTGAIATFGIDMAMSSRFPAFNQWSLVTLGRFVEHVDFLSIFQWLSGSFIRISLALFIILDILDLPKGKKRAIPLLFICVLILAGLQVPLSDEQFMNIMSSIYLPVSFFVMTGTVLLLFVIVLVKRKEGVPRREKEVSGR
ncbi:GerAB/ArcD/ProY family transporter [Alteribacter natronophilus]|uniref:GerAB/ArcD/ProY family transporter n=1 Tax=Alteribacter natronophilus TaxID=2583810 RepID=UPI00110EB0CB|nr:endospore germination permease [Alteribacter natronophilus]TMW70892.1 spore gernimation protein XB [Alteribacter natronophilus]